MKVGIAFCGEGRGHLTRIVAVARLLKHKHELVFWCTENRWDELTTAFPDTPIHLLPHMHFSMEDYSVRFIKTGISNCRNVFTYPWWIGRLTKECAAEGIDLVLSDWEPFLSRVADRAGIPLVLLNHPGIVLSDSTFTLPAFYARMAARAMMPPSGRKVICSFYNGTVGPILREEIKQVPRGDDGFFILYAREEIREWLIQVLSHVPDIRVKVFPNREEDFVTEFGRCSGLITSAGHQIISEALHLKKPCFVIPFGNQHEQRMNAGMLLRSGWGDFAEIHGVEKSLKNFVQEVRKGVYPKQADRGVDFVFEDETQRVLDIIEEELVPEKTGILSYPALPTVARYMVNSSSPSTPRRVSTFS
jgi:uncharacterized protein (TIGR00661 family)